MRSINESQCKHWAQALLDTGLVSEGGFEYFVVQEPCFGARDNVTGEITESGEYRRRWPNGMKAFGDWLHQRGMKLGIYTDIGTLTCGHCVGSAGHVQQDMELFASWGADLIEVDACGGAVDEATWAEYRDAINATGRPMVHSICAEGMASVWTWGMGVGNMWRVNGDIQDGWLNIVQGLNAAMAIPNLESYSGPGGWCVMQHPFEPPLVLLLPVMDAPHTSSLLLLRAQERHGTFEPSPRSLPAVRVYLNFRRCHWSAHRTCLRSGPSPAITAGAARASRSRRHEVTLRSGRS
jgi:hypothetical protein